MKTELIAETWDTLGDRQIRFIETFYGRLFERFPGYRKLFPRKLDPAHLGKMAQTLALVASFADEEILIAPRLHKVGAAHRPYNLQPRDMHNFAIVFTEVLGEYAGEHWTDAAEQAWREAFDQVVFPLMDEGERAP